MGRIVGSFGVQGWLKVKPFTESAAALGEFEAWVVGGEAGWSEHALEDFEVHSKGPVAKLAGCGDRESADALRGLEVAVRRSELQAPGDGTMYQVDLVGLEVVEEGGAALGRVESFFATGETSGMVVRGERERLLPFIPAYVKAVDREAGLITVEWKADYDA
jgi:16S rRNA processing protein RimM